MKDISEIERSIYRDLSPVQNAIQQFAKLLPSNDSLLSDETWHFYHFKTNDYATMRHTIDRACIVCGWNVPMFVFMEDFITADKKTSPRDLESSILNKKFVENKPVFVCFHGIENNKHSSLTEQQAMTFRVMEAFSVYCAKQRNLQNDYQRGNKQPDPNRPAFPIYNRLFFVSYGMECFVPPSLQPALTTITYPSLEWGDFESLLWEYHLRKERYLQQKRKKRGLPEREIAFLDISREQLEWYANRMSGLEEIVVRRLLSSMDSAFKNGYADYSDLETVDTVIINYKNDILRRHGRLELVSPDGGRLGGLETVKKWIDNHENAIKSYKSPPSGIMLVGIPGTGKSAIAHEAAKRLKLPLVRMDMSRILGGRVGDSEKGMSEMLEDLKFVAPCVLWIDEIEKTLSGANGNNGDGGTLKRLFGMLLTFIQENKKPVFTVTTANDISSLPPEFFRNGRFDQRFYLMMPSYDKCREIMLAKMNKYSPWKHTYSLNEAQQLFDACTGSPEHPRFLTGADIEAHVKELFWRCLTQNITQYPDEEGFLAEMMKEIANDIQAQASPDAEYSMESVAKSYLDMMQRGFQNAEEDIVYTQKNLMLDKILYYKFNPNDPQELPLCMNEPEQYKEYKDTAAIINDEIKNKPSQWYDARFFYELVSAMNKCVIMDKNICMEQTRLEYWTMMSNKNKPT